MFIDKIQNKGYINLYITHYHKKRCVILAITPVLLISDISCGIVKRRVMSGLAQRHHNVEDLETKDFGSCMELYMSVFLVVAVRDRLCDTADGEVSCRKLSEY